MKIGYSFCPSVLFKYILMISIYMNISPSILIITRKMFSNSCRIVGIKVSV